MVAESRSCAGVLSAWDGGWGNHKGCPYGKGVDRAAGGCFRADGKLRVCGKGAFEGLDPRLRGNDTVPALVGRESRLAAEHAWADGVGVDFLWGSVIVGCMIGVQYPSRQISMCYIVGGEAGCR